MHETSLAEKHPRSAETTAARWFGVGHSLLPDAGEAALEATLAALAGREAKLLLVFSCDAYDPDRILRAIATVARDASVAGCSTAGELSADGAGDHGIVVTALGGEGVAVETAAGPRASEDLRAAGATAAACSAKLPPQARSRMLMLLTDGRAGDQAEVLGGVHEVVGSGVPLIGGCAGDGVRMRGTFQMIGGRVLRDSVVGVAIASTGPLGLGWSHGWQQTGDPILITRSDANRIERIDDLPALDSYLDHFHAPPEVREDPAAFTRWARVHPIGLGRRQQGQQPVRCVQEADFESRSIICTAEIPPGGIAWFMRGDAESVLASTRSACGSALQALEGSSPLGMVAFNCVGRRAILGEQGIARELEIMNEVVDAPIAGFYTYGEIARTRGVDAVHGQTLAALALG